jgi:hypothetical protein
MARIPRACAAALALFVGASLAEPPAPDRAAELRAKYDALRASLDRNGFGRPLHLVSTEDSRADQGEVYAVVEAPFSVVEAAFASAAQWCDVLILPFNIKHCRAADEASKTMLLVRIGRKSMQPAQDAYRLDFDYRREARTADYFRSTLDAAKGPVGTHDYRISLEATPIDARRTFVRLVYSFGFGAASRLAMTLYLNTAGSGKVGFTVTGRDDHGAPEYVGGLRGATERNVMRYYLAIEAYLASLSAPEGERVARRLAGWFAANEGYARQLHEMDRGEYLAMKEREAARVGAAL